MRKREKGMAHRAKRRTGEPDYSGLHAGRDAKHGFFPEQTRRNLAQAGGDRHMQNTDFSRGWHTRYKPKIFSRSGYATVQILPENASLFTQTPIFPEANTPAINKNFLFMAGVFQTRILPENASLFTQTPIFPGANTPAINKNFLFMASMFRARILHPDPGFSGVKHGPGTDRIRRTGGWHAGLSAKRRFFQRPTHPPSTKIFCSWRVCSKHGFCRKMRHFSRKRRFFPGPTHPPSTKIFCSWRVCSGTGFTPRSVFGH